MNVDPRPFELFKEWADATSLPLSRLIIVPTPPKEDWQQWGLEVIQQPNVARYQPPTPSGFNSWKEWAIRFNQVVPL